MWRTLRSEHDQIMTSVLREITEIKSDLRVLRLGWAKGRATGSTPTNSFRNAASLQSRA
jgi:hypothetical protein